MKISEVIAELQAFLDTKGDLPCAFEDSTWRCGNSIGRISIQELASMEPWRASYSSDADLGCLFVMIGFKDYSK